jgi:LAS superfamily LD-carboxypeptidase LdcB
VEKLTFKYIFPFVVLAISLILIVASWLLNFEKKREKEALMERIVAEQKMLEEAQKKAEQKIYLMGKFDPSTRENFVSVPEAYNVGGYKMYLRKETLDAFSKMREVAKKDGINLAIASATRNFIYQKNLWNNKWSGFTLVDGKDLSKSIPDGAERFKKILEYSAAPSTSRHHWGSDIDINAATPEYFKTPKGALVYEWLNKNAPLFGFCQPYNAKGPDRPTGYNEEKWHWSYLPISRTLTRDYPDLIDEKDINGFLGEEYVSKLNLINDYVLGINPECL